MPKSLKRTADIDIFDFGKAVTLILSQVKELNKTRNTLVDDINYLESRKSQETQDLERIIVEKGDVLKLKSELTEKIIAKKAEFLEFVNIENQRLQAKEADLTIREQEFADANIKAGQILDEQRNELKIRSNEATKEINSRKAELDSREISLIERENAIQAGKDANIAKEAKLLDQQKKLGQFEAEIRSQDEARGNKQHELDSRELAIIVTETELEKQQSSLASLATDLQSQATLIEREKNKNKSDAELIRDLNKSIRDKQSELNAREIHFNDREATALSR